MLILALKNLKGADVAVSRFVKRNFPLALLFLLLLAGIAQAKSAKDVDFRIDRDYDFAALKSVCLWPAVVESMPENVALSMPGKIDEWMEKAMKSKNMRNAFYIKPVKGVWQSVELLYGDGGFKDPFESAESAAYFYSHLDGACGAVMKMTVSVETERKWREPYTETYQTTERVHSQERRRNSDGKYEYVDVYIDVPVTKTRNVPGYWYILANGSCHLEFFDTKKLDGRPVAEARVVRNDQSDTSDERSMLEKLVGRMVDDTIVAVFFK